VSPDGVRPIGPVGPAPAAGAPRQPASGQAFRAALDQALIWSKHADRRVAERQVVIRPEEARQVAGAVTEARQRGVRSLVVVLGESVMLVAPPTNTVVTAMPRAEADRRLFTNVDAVVLLGRS
jgi:flagellar operon protein